MNDGRPVHLLVMELVEGDGLDEIIARGPILFDEALTIALQIAEGLQAAHERGIVHRDLKPENVKIRRDGAVKILDFGLATTWVEGSTDDGESLYPTVTRHPTSAGAVLGTAAYMSPEQARGRSVDRRTDIWAFGCLLYEMLTAAKAFPGETLSDTLAAVLKDDPDWSALPGGIEPVALHVLRRCLAKEPGRRFHDIADVRIELEEAAAVASSRHEARPLRRRRGGRWMVAGCAAAGTVAMVGLLAGVRARYAPQPVFRALTFQVGRVASARFAPDGKTVVFGMSTRDRPLALLSTRTDSVESQRLDLPPADILGISRDGQMAILLDRHCEGSWVSVGTLAAANLAGGAARPILERVNDGDISTDGARMAVVREVGHVQRLEYPLGSVLFQTSGWISHVRIAPDGKRVAFLHHPYYGDDQGVVTLVDADGTVSNLTEELSDSLQGLAWSPDGRTVWFSGFVFGQGGVLQSVRPGALPQLRLRTPVNIRIQDIASDGRALVVSGDTRAEVAGLLAGQTGERRFEGWGDDSIGGLSADGTMLAGNLQVATVGGEYAAFARGANGLPAVRIGYGEVFGMSPDAKWVFTRRMAGERKRLVLLPTGPGEPRTIDLGEVRPDDSSTDGLTCTLDGRHAAFAGYSGRIGPRIYVLDVDDGRLQPVGPVGTTGPVISPDGTRVAAISPDGIVTVYPVPDGSPEVVPGISRGERPLQWLRDGRALLVWDRTFPARVHRVDIHDGLRELALEITGRDLNGVLYGQLLLTPGGDYYVYRWRRDLNTLLLVEAIA